MVYFAVKRGHKIGVYSKKSDLDKQIKNFGNPCYKLFNNFEDAKSFITEPPKPPFTIEECPCCGFDQYNDGRMVSYEELILHQESLATPIVIYTDGSIYNLDKKIGAGFGVYYGENSPNNVGLPMSEVTLKGPKTILRAEICGILYSLQALENNPHKKLLYKTDNKQVVHVLTKALSTWVNTHWKGGGVSNQDLWERCHLLMTRRTARVSVEFVKGHNGELGNEEADRLARIGSGIDYENQLQYT
jgi:ribonuclease HI